VINEGSRNRTQTGGLIDRVERISQEPVICCCAAVPCDGRPFGAHNATHLGDYHGLDDLGLGCSESGRFHQPYTSCCREYYGRRGVCLPSGSAMFSGPAKRLTIGQSRFNAETIKFSSDNDVRSSTSVPCSQSAASSIPLHGIRYDTA
jgi:hypothetical protein